MWLKHTDGHGTEQEKGMMGSRYQVWRSLKAKSIILDLCGKEWGHVVVWHDSLGVEVITESKYRVQGEEGYETGQSVALVRHRVPQFPLPCLGPPESDIETRIPRSTAWGWEEYKTGKGSQWMSRLPPRER